MSDISRLSPPTHDAWDWQSHGACRDLDATVFFHPDFERGHSRARRTARAKAVCAACPVLQECQEHALTVQETYGTWGGLDELERRDIIRTLRRPGTAAPASGTPRSSPPALVEPPGGRRRCEVVVNMSPYPALLATGSTRHDNATRPGRGETETTR